MTLIMTLILNFNFPVNARSIHISPKNLIKKLTIQCLAKKSNAHIIE